MQLVLQKLATLAPTVSIKHAKVKDLRVSTCAISRGSRAIHVTNRTSSQSHWSPLCKCRNLNRTGLECVLIVWSLPTRKRYAKMMLRALERYSDYCHLPRNANHRRWQPVGATRVMG